MNSDILVGVKLLFYAYKAMFGGYLPKFEQNLKNQLYPIELTYKKPLNKPRIEELSG